MEKEYVYFTSNSNVVISMDFDSLKKQYFNLLNKNLLDLYGEQFEKEFNENIQEDGYLIVDDGVSGNIYFFLDVERIDNVYRDIYDERIMEVLKSKNDIIIDKE